MLRLNRRQRTAVSDSLRQVGNLIMGALALGQFVSGRPIVWTFVIGGIVTWAVFVLLGVTLLSGEEP
jgi:hypothetical protein